MNPIICATPHSPHNIFRYISALASRKIDSESESRKSILTSTRSSCSICPICHRQVLCWNEECNRLLNVVWTEPIKSKVGKRDREICVWWNYRILTCDRCQLIKLQGIWHLTVNAKFVIELKCIFQASQFVNCYISLTAVNKAQILIETSSLTCHINHQYIKSPQSLHNTSVSICLSAFPFTGPPFRVTID